MSPKSIVWDYGYTGLVGSHPYANQVLLFDIYIEAPDSYLRNYYNDGPKLCFNFNRYKISWDERRGVVHIDTDDGFLAVMNAVAGSEMKVISATADKIVFTAPIKEFMYKYWALRYFDGGKPDLPKRDYTGLYVIWEKADPERFADAEPW